jgi:hypothetical protein
MQSFSPERKNLIFFLLKNPHYGTRFVCYAVLRVLVHVIRRTLLLTKTNRKKIRQHSKRTRNVTILFEKLPKVISLQKLASQEQTEVQLAGKCIPITQRFDWKYVDPDIENTFSLNRFGWLMTLLCNNPSEKMSRHALYWISNWIDVMGNDTNHSAWESYSVSERLSNWPFILLMARHFTDVSSEQTDKIAQSMTFQVQYLLENLELKGALTNNHILNNARGLYIGGLTLGDNEAVSFAKRLFYEWTPKLFHEDGMLREHSSHYQFLLCQRYEQVYYLSRSFQDDSFTDFMGQWSTLMKGICNFFSVYGPDKLWSMPLFGDISPDYPPVWFSPYSKEGWSTIKEVLGWKE